MEEEQMEKMDKKVAELWEFLLRWEIATQAELELATGLTGYNEKTLNDVLYIRTGNRSTEQYLYDIGEIE